MLETSIAAAIALKSTCLLLAAGVASRALASRTSAIRHALWTGALLLSALMPIAVLTLPSLAVIPASWMPPEKIEVALSAVAPADVSTQYVWYFALKLWLSGALILLVRLVISQAALIRWRLKARLLQSGAWAETLKYVSRRMPISRSLRVLESPAVVNPCTWGIFRPVLLLPASGDAWSESERRLAVMHELAHIRRNDYLAATMVRLACAIHWYNPLVWLAARESRKLQEQACDDAVLRSGAAASDYASFLRRAAEKAQGMPQRLAPSMGVAGRSELRQRVDSILDPARPRTQLSSAPAIGVWMTVACLAFFFAAAVPQSPAHSRDSLPLQARVADEEAFNEDGALVADEALAAEEVLRVDKSAAFEESVEESLEVDESLEVEESVELPSMPDAPASPESVPAAPPLPAVPAVPPVPPAPPTLPAPPTPPTPPTPPDEIPPARA